jgi:hypothetical protein
MKCLYPNCDNDALESSNYCALHKKSSGKMPKVREVFGTRVGAKKAVVNKSHFIRALPTTLSAVEVVKRAKAAGIRFGAAYVYRVRASADAKKKAVTRTATRGAVARTKPITSKASFVRSLPATIPAKAVIGQAKAAGMKLSLAYVYTIRAKAKENRGSTRAGRSVPRPITTSSLAESLLRALGAELGLGHAIELLAAERAKVLAVLG